MLRYKSSDFPRCLGFLSLSLCLCGERVLTVNRQSSRMNLSKVSLEDTTLESCKIIIISNEQLIHNGEVKIA